MRIKIAVAICIFIGIFNSIGLYLLNTSSEEKIMKAEGGVLSLEQWDEKQKGIIKLGGEWEFYPDLLICPEQGRDVFQEYASQKQLKDFSFKSSWKTVSDSSTKKGTLRLVIHLREDAVYGIGIKGLQHNTAFYLNGKISFNSGIVGQESGEEWGPFHLQDRFAPSENGQFEIVILFSELRLEEAGRLPVPDFGKADRMTEHRYLYIILDVFMISGYFVLGIFFLGNYFLENRARHSLFLGLFLLLQALHSSGEGERLLLLILPPVKKLSVFYEFQVHLAYLSSFCFLICIFHLFRPYISKKIVICLSCLLLVIGPAILWRGDILTIQSHKVIISVIVMMNNVYILSVMIRSLIKGVEGAEYILVAIINLLYFYVTVILGFLFNLNIGKMSALLFLIMVICITLYLNYRIQLTYRQIDSLSRQLLLNDQNKNQFLARTCGELAKPVGEIFAVSEECLARAEKPETQILREEMLRINTEAWYINRILEELTEILGNSQGKQELFPEPTGETSFLEIVEELDHLLPRNALIKIKKQIPERFPTIFTDRSRLKEILYHLLHNAVKFTDWGEITIRVEAVGDMAHITVKDTGIGIDRAQMGAIFTAFYQEKGTEQETEGLGLGLTIAKKLVELQGGEIWAVSEPGRGASFTFSLPLAGQSHTAADGTDGSEAVGSSYPEAETEGEAAAAGEPESGPGTGWRRRQVSPVRYLSQAKHGINVPDKNVILVIGGIFRDGEETRQLKEMLGYPVAAVGSGMEALEFVEHNQVDLVLTDLILSDMSGYELCRKLREKHSISELPVIILDDAGQAKNMQRSFQSGANDFMSKPVSWEELKARIEARLSAKKSAQGTVMRELRNLHAQIMPHFLYNTLNTIIGLSHKDTEQACEALQHLSTYFRAKLDFSGTHSLIPLDRELELMKAYLAIERMRYNERLEVIYDIDESIYFMLPALTLQPLVENAVQHGITDHDTKVTIRISIQKDSDKGYVIQISDNGPGIPEEKRQELLAGDYHRIGFSNVLRKVRLLEGSGLWLDSSESGTCITIYISREYRYGV
ncbi:sensor histidine kinase YesM [Anaerotaenia torta]|uniref:ATP-binding protein n=1 Tax=Anaerotaenia torta TaxID=433293 RepID=UPI003D190ABF